MFEIELITAGIAALVVFLYLISIAALVVFLYLISHTPVEHYKTCQYCRKRNYLGTTTDSEFERDHLKQYRCKRCNADLFKET